MVKLAFQIGNRTRCLDNTTVSGSPPLYWRADSNTRKQISSHLTHVKKKEITLTKFIGDKSIRGPSHV